MSKKTFVIGLILVALLLCAFAPAGIDRAVRNVMLDDNDNPPPPNETAEPVENLPPNQTPVDNYEPTLPPCTPNDITCICDPNTIVCYRVP